MRKHIQQEIIALITKVRDLKFKHNTKYKIYYTVQESMRK